MSKRKIVLRRKEFFLSQSFMCDALSKDVCPKYLEYKFVDHLETDDEEKKNAMFKGRYFEWHLLGATRDGIEPKFERNRDNSMKAAETDLIGTISHAKTVLNAMGLSTDEGEKQLTIKTDSIICHMDWKTKDILNPERMALYDVKYTETLVDDYWNGWANFETKHDSQTQARHYIIGNYMLTGEYLPFYFLIFGKSKWVRVIKIEITEDGVNQHQNAMQRSFALANQWIESGWQAKPEFNKCVACGYNKMCRYKATKPTIETFKI